MIYNALASKERDLKKLSKDIDNYIVSQLLIGNKEAIIYKLKREEINNNIAIQWKESSQNYSNNILFSFPYNWKVTHHVHSITEGDFGTYTIIGSFLNDSELIKSILIKISLFVFVLILFLWTLWPLYYRIPQSLILKPITELLATIDESGQWTRYTKSKDSNIKEIK